MNDALLADPERGPYSGYAAIKGWTSDRVEVDAGFFDELWARVRLGCGLRVLEIGFGSGAFLDWARSRGHKPTGIDILPETLDATRRRGHDVRPGPLTDKTFVDERFDVVFALDVFEHLSLSEIHECLDLCLRLLDGPPTIVLRFPNGASPLSMRYQNTDVTHKTVLSAPKMAQIAAHHHLVTTQVDILRYPKGFGRRLRRSVAYAMRRLISSAVGYAYFGGPINLDPNVIVVLSGGRTASS